MIRSSVTVSLVPEARGGPFIFWDDLPAACRHAQHLGFDAIEIFPPAPDFMAIEDVQQLLREHNLKLSAVGTGAGWVKHKLHLALPQATARREARDFIQAIIDFAGPLGAPAIIGSMQGRWGDGISAATARGYLVESLSYLGEYAAKYNVPLLFEPINRYESNQANSLETGLGILKDLRSQNVLLLADLFHMNIEEVNIAEAIRAARGKIGHVHFVDSNRRPAGMGHLDYGPIAAALWAIGYDRYASAEALPYPDSFVAAQQTINAFRQHFATH